METNNTGSDAKVYKVHFVHVNPDGDTAKQLIAKYMLDNGVFHILEDHADLFDKSLSGGQITPDLQAQLDGFSNSSYHETQDVDSPEHFLENLPVSGVPDLVSHHQTVNGNNPQTEFNITRDGKLYRLCYNGKTGTYTLNNSSLSTVELEGLLEEIRSQRANLEMVSDSFTGSDLGQTIANNKSKPEHMSLPQSVNVPITPQEVMAFGHKDI